MLNRKQWLYVAIFFFLFASLLLLYYILVIMPQRVEIADAKQQLETEKQLLQTVEQQLQERELVIKQDSLLFQQQLPVEPLLEQFVLDIEKAEIVSESFISNMSFQVGEVTETDRASDTEADIELMEKRAEALNQVANEEGAVDESEGQTEVEEIALPEGVERLTVNLSVSSPTYEHLITFLTELEQLERITKIDSLSFSGGDEITALTDVPESLEYSMTISTFYFPVLQELRDELPKLELPEPSYKTNPLPQGNLLSPETAKTAMAQLQQSDLFSYETVSHRVQEGETLYSISRKYYTNYRQGMELIRKRNGMSDNTVYLGRTILIPKDPAIFK